MSSVRQQVLGFLRRCEQLKKSKFIMATTRIKDLLKCIVNSPVLYELFQTATSRFDYVSAKRRCFVTSHEGFLSHSTLVLPENAGDRLAFIFCLLVEFDHDTINFNTFLQQFFPDDGSYYSSFHAFCDVVIVALEDILRELFSEELNGAKLPSQPAPPVAEGSANSYVGYSRPVYGAQQPAVPVKTHSVPAPTPEPSDSVTSFGIAVPKLRRPSDSPRSGVLQGLQSNPTQPVNAYAAMPPRPVPGASAAENLSAVSLLIAYESDIISRSLMPDSEKQDGICMLTEIEKGVREGNRGAVDALLRGYEYYSACHNNFSQLTILLRSTLGG